MLHENLIVIALNDEQHRSTCGYWYLVKERGSAHTAFATLGGLLRWLVERGLECDVPTAVPVEDYGKGLTNYAHIVGQYATQMHFSMDEFYAMKTVVRTKTLSNGDYVDALITQEDGYRTVHTLNPNVRDRRTYPYFETRQEMS